MCCRGVVAALSCEPAGYLPLGDVERVGSAEPAPVRVPPSDTIQRPGWLAGRMTVMKYSRSVREHQASPGRSEFSLRSAAIAPDCPTQVPLSSDLSAALRYLDASADAWS